MLSASGALSWHRNRFSRPSLGSGRQRSPQQSQAWIMESWKSDSHYCHYIYIYIYIIMCHCSFCMSLYVFVKSFCKFLSFILLHIASFPIFGGEENRNLKHYQACSCMVQDLWQAPSQFRSPVATPSMAYPCSMQAIENCVFCGPQVPTENLGAWKWARGCPGPGLRSEKRCDQPLCYHVLALRECLSDRQGLGGKTKCKWNMVQRFRLSMIQIETTLVQLHNFTLPILVI